MKIRIDDVFREFRKQKLQGICFRVQVFSLRERGCFHDTKQLSPSLLSLFSHLTQTALAYLSPVFPSWSCSVI